MTEREDAVGQSAEGHLRRAGEPVREAVLYERVRVDVPDLAPEELLGVLEALATRGHLHVTVEHDWPARDPEPFEPRFWRVGA
jgi:hypothetical protein